MISITPDTVQQDVEGFVRSWLRLLAQSRLAEACSQLDEPNSHGIMWTPTTIRQVVADTFSPETRFYRDHPEGPIFTDPDDLPPPRADMLEVVAFDDGTGHWFDYPVPLNGKWSDLTAQFEFHRRPGGYAVILHDLHVM